MPDTSASPAGSSQDRSRTLEYALCAILLIAAAVLFFRTASQARRYESVNRAAPADAIADAADRTARLHDVVGTFATGKDEGDRIMVIDANGRVLFHPMGTLAKSLAVTDTYQLRRRGNRTCLLTAKSGSIDAIDIDHLTFSGDIYERAQ